MKLLHPLYDQKYRTITEVNCTFIHAICKYLDIRTKISYSWDYDLHPEKSERLASIVEQAEGSHYVSGPAAKSYLVNKPFANRNITVEWFDYSEYKAYDQLWGAFEGHVSIVDLLFNHGPNSKNFMFSNLWRQNI